MSDGINDGYDHPIDGCFRVKESGRVSEKKIVLPEGMLKAVQSMWFEYIPDDSEHQKLILEAALLWLSENPIAPTKKQQVELHVASTSAVGMVDTSWIATEWQRRMFLADPIDSRRHRIIEVLSQYPGRSCCEGDSTFSSERARIAYRAPEIADKILDALDDKG